LFDRRDVLRMGTAALLGTLTPPILANDCPPDGYTYLVSLLAQQEQHITGRFNATPADIQQLVKEERGIPNAVAVLVKSPLANIRLGLLDGEIVPLAQHIGDLANERSFDIARLRHTLESTDKYNAWDIDRLDPDKHWQKAPDYGILRAVSWATKTTIDIKFSNGNTVVKRTLSFSATLDHQGTSWSYGAVVVPFGESYATREGIRYRRSEFDSYDAMVHALKDSNPRTLIYNHVNGNDYNYWDETPQEAVRVANKIHVAQPGPRIRIGVIKKTSGVNTGRH
jgi:hypothetical protein